jgi:AsmA protein
MTSRWIRRIALGLGALVLVAVVAVGVLLATFDANRVKSLAVEAMKTRYQRTLVLGGPIELSVFPRLAVKLSQVRLSERGRDAEFAAIDEASLGVQVLPLLRKELAVGRVSARGVRLNYQRDAQGASNIDDLLGPPSDPSKDPAGTPGASGQALRFDVSAVQIEDLRLGLRDDKAKLAGDVVLQSFTAGRLANQVETPVTLKAAVKLSQPQPVALALDGKTTLQLDLDAKSVALSNASLTLAGDAAAVKGLATTLDGAVAWDGKAVRAGPLKLTVKQAALGRTTLADTTLELQRALFDPAGQRLELQALQLALAGKLGGQDAFALKLAWPKLAVDPQRLDGSALSGSVKLDGATALAGDFASGAPTGRFDALRLPELQLGLKGKAGPRQVDTRVKADLVLDAGRAAATIERLAVTGTLSDPGLQPLQLSVQGSGSASAKAAAWKLAGSLNTNRFESSGQAALDGKVPQVKASARFDSLDLNTLLHPDKPEAAAAAKPTTTAPADTPVQLDGLKAVDGQFTLDAGALAFRQYRVTDARVAATLERGTLVVSRLAGRTWGGSVEASARAEADSRRVAVKLDATGVNVQALLKNVADKDLLEGTGRVAADLTTQGASVGAMRSNLAGTANLQLRDGAIKGINLARSLRQAKAALSMKQDAATQASATEKTDFSELRASARIANGVAQSDDLDVKSPFLRINGAGRFDIGQGRIDYTARATVTDTSKGQDGADLAALRGITVPVQLTGPFDAIGWKIQWSAIAAAAVEQQVKDKLAEKLGERLGLPKAAGTADGAASAPAQQPKDVLKDKLLKGLFGK